MEGGGRGVNGGHVGGGRGSGYVGRGRWRG